MEARYELFDHTADMGVRVWAEDLPALIPPAVEGFYATIGELATAGSAEPFEFARLGDAPEMLLRDFLNELLILFERDRSRLVEFKIVEFDNRHLRVVGNAVGVDLDQSASCREVKAITYHELAVRPIDDGIEAIFIVDI